MKNRVTPPTRRSTTKATGENSRTGVSSATTIQRVDRKGSQKRQAATRTSVKVTIKVGCFQVE